MIAFACALPNEAASIRPLGNFEAVETGGPKGVEIYKGGIRGLDAALIVSGVGEQNAYIAARAVMSSLPIKAYISIGLSAGLTTDACKGYVVLGERVVGGDAVYPASPLLLEAARSALAGWKECVCGGLVAAPKVVCLASGKAGYAGTGCIALDMETSGAAKAAGEAGVPFLAVRAISDTSEEDLPVDFSEFIKGGRLDMKALVCHLLMNPSKVPDVIRLGKSSKLALGNLMTAVNTMIDRLKEFDGRAA